MGLDGAGGRVLLDQVSRRPLVVGKREGWIPNADLQPRYFNDTASADKTIGSIIAYMPTVAHWGWNGNARRYWDFIYGGKLQRLERQIHHYGSGLNALPLLAAYRSDPDAADLHLLRVGTPATPRRCRTSTSRASPRRRSTRGPTPSPGMRIPVTMGRISWGTC